MCDNIGDVADCDSISSILQPVADENMLRRKQLAGRARFIDNIFKKK